MRAAAKPRPSIHGRFPSLSGRLPRATAATLTALLATLGTSTVAQAGGFDIPDNGTRAVGRGGSYVVGVSDPTAVYYNPAALSKQRGTQFLYNHNLVFHDTRFARAPLSDVWGDDAGTTFDEAKNKERLFALGGFAALTSDFGLDNWHFGLSFFGPPAVGKHDYPDYGPQSFMLTSMDVLVAFYSATVAWKYKDYFGIGVTGSYADLISMEYSLAVDGTLTGQLNPVPDMASEQLTTTLNLKDRASGTAVVGLWGRPHRRVELAVAARVVPIFFKAKGTVDVDKETLVTDEVTVELPLTLPAKVRGGVRYIHPSKKDPSLDVFDIELGAYWENWSVVDSLRPNLSGQISAQDLGQLDIRKEWKDTLSLRLGGDLNVLPALAEGGKGPHPVSWTVRAGGFYESAAANDNYSNLDFPAFARTGVSGGMSVGWRGIALTVAYSHIFQDTRSTNETFAKQFQQRPLRPCPDQCGGFDGVPANAGTFTSKYDIVSVGLDFRFRELIGDRRAKKKGGEDGIPPARTQPAPAEDEAESATSDETGEGDALDDALDDDALDDDALDDDALDDDALGAAAGAIPRRLTAR